MAWLKKIKDELGDDPILNEIAILKSRVSKLEQKYGQKAREVSTMNENARSIHKVEEFNGEQVPEQEESSMSMGYQDKLQSLKNAIKILPPNLIVNGRHTAKNAGAICGFIVTDEMMDDVYSAFSHEA
jgi:hypothetical protein